MLPTSQSDSSQIPLGDYYVEPACANQQLQSWDYVEAQPLDTSAVSMSQFTFHFSPEELAMLNGPFGQDLGVSQEASFEFPQGVVADQVPYSFIPVPEPPMVVPSQLVPVTQMTPAFQLTHTTQPPQTTHQVPYAVPMVQAYLAPGIARKEAVQVRSALMLFRLNQVHNELIKVPRSDLKPFSELGLELSIEEEYQAVAEGGIPLFIVEEVDWDTAFGQLGESAFHIFMREELEKSWSQGVILPPLDPDLQFYVTTYPLNEDIYRCLRDLQGAIERGL